MLKYVLFDCTFFADGDDRAQTEQDLCWLLEALTQRNQDYLKQRPYTPRLYKSGVVWEKPKQFDGECYEVQVMRQALGPNARQRDVRKVLEKMQGVFGGEHFCDIGVILELGAIDCDGLCAWRTAELRQAGIPARPMMTSRHHDGGTTYHAIVRWPPFGDELSGNPYQETDEDPSLLLGMHQPERSTDRNLEIQKNRERCEYILRCKQRGIVPGTSVNLDAALQDVMGIRPVHGALLSAIDDILLASLAA